MGEESCIPLRSSMALSSNASHGGTPLTLLAQHLDILMTTHRLAMGLYLSCLHPHLSSWSQSDSHFNAIHETSPMTHQACVGALTAAHGLLRAGLLRAGKYFFKLACVLPDVVLKKDRLWTKYLLWPRLWCSFRYTIFLPFLTSVFWPHDRIWPGSWNGVFESFIWHSYHLHDVMHKLG